MYGRNVCNVLLLMFCETVLINELKTTTATTTTKDYQSIELYKQLEELSSKAGMHARELLSNSPKVLEKIPIESRASEVDITKEPFPRVKTLGITWLLEDDVFTFKTNPPDKSFQLTKRNFIRKIAT